MIIIFAGVEFKSCEVFEAESTLICCNCSKFKSKISSIKSKLYSLAFNEVIKSNKIKRFFCINFPADKYYIMLSKLY